MVRFTVADFYSGPGGLSRGILDAKFNGHAFDVILANDVDENASMTYKKNHPNVKMIVGSLALEKTKNEIQQEIKKIIGQNKVDVIIGGPPCQGFSITNKVTRTKSNPLNHLVLDFVEMVQRLKPYAFVMENVPGMTSMQNGKILEKLTDNFYDLGYKNVDCWLLNAAEFGVPQFRKRAFLVGSKSKQNIERPIKTHGDAEEVKKNPTLKPYVTLSDALSDLPYIPIGKQSSSDKYRNIHKNEFQRVIRHRSKKVTNHVVTTNSDLIIRRFKAVPQGGNWKDIPKKLLQINGTYKNLQNAHGMIYRRLLGNQPSVTITNFRKAMLIHPTQNRLLSVREAARIQTFPDIFEFEGPLHCTQQQVSDAVPIKIATIVGNAVLKNMVNSLEFALEKHR